MTNKNDTINVRLQSNATQLQPSSSNRMRALVRAHARACLQNEINMNKLTKSLLCLSILENEYNQVENLFNGNAATRVQFRLYKVVI